MSELPDFVIALQKRLMLDLPGERARSPLSPPHRPMLDDAEIAQRNPFIASVLVLLHPDPCDVHPALVLIERSKGGGVHSGQIALPGGKQEAGESSLETALREAQEEIGVNPHAVHVLGQLSRLYVPPSNFLVFPFVGWMMQKPELEPNPQEVSRMFSLNLGAFLQQDAVVRSRVSGANGHQFDVPAFQIDEHLIWGATAMMLAELLEVYSDARSEFE
ncbi:MAG: NUDIX hydrolase [Bacteroidota bacterium]